MCKRTASLAGAMISLCLLVAGHAEAQVFVERGVLPQNMHGLVAKCETLVVGRVVRVSEFFPIVGPPIKAPMTQYDVLVTDVIKQGERSERAGVTVEVVVDGLGGNDTELGLEERFKSGDELILGLVWWPSRGVYALSLGADSAFHLKAGKVHPRGRSQFSVGLKGRTADEFVRNLRAELR